MTIHLIQVPYDSGHRARRMGQGPLHLIERGAALNRLRQVEPEGVHLLPIEIGTALPTEIGTAFELHRSVSGAVARAARDGILTIVLSGNCNSAVGTVSGLQAADRPELTNWPSGTHKRTKLERGSSNLKRARHFGCSARAPVRVRNDGKQVFSAGLSGVVTNGHFGA